jgi:hypothetical protein
MSPMRDDMASLELTLRHTTDVGSYLDRVGDFLRRPVAHSVLLSRATSRLGEQSTEGAEPNLWLWVEDGGEGARLGGGPAVRAMGQATYAADAVTIPSGIDGRLRQATRDDAPLLRVWSEEFVAEAGVIAAPGDAIGRRIDAASLFVWEVDGTVVSMAAATPP